MTRKGESVVKRRYECARCKAHIFGEVLLCGVCGEVHDSLAQPILLKQLNTNRARYGEVAPFP